MTTITKYIEENLFGCIPPEGTAQENYDGFISSWGDLKMDDGYEITVDDIQNYMDQFMQGLE